MYQLREDLIYVLHRIVIQNKFCDNFVATKLRCENDLL